VIEGSEAGAGLLAKVLVDKGEDHLPIERQQRRLEREGLTVPISTLTGWWSQSADLLRPLQGALAREAMGAWLPQVDGTGLDVLDRDHPKGLRHGTIWTAVGGRAVAFVFTPAKSRGLGELLALRPALDADGVALVEEAAPTGETGAVTRDAAHEGRDGDGEEEGDDGEEGATGSAVAGTLRRVSPVQCDGEKIFGSALRKLGVACVLVHCWMHARRYFERAQKARDPRANLPLALIGRMYDIERVATEQGVSDEERARRRQAESWPLLEELRKWVEATRPKAPPSTPLGKAIRYVEARWLSLCVFVLDGRIPMDDGEVERFIRRIATYGPFHRRCLRSYRDPLPLAPARRPARSRAVSRAPTRRVCDRVRPARRWRRRPVVDDRPRRLRVADAQRTAVLDRRPARCAAPARRARG
jgi:hypothetical protein